MTARRLIETGRELGEERAMLADADADLDDLG
jgi:hypothetical protein